MTFGKEGASAASRFANKPLHLERRHSGARRIRRLGASAASRNDCAAL